MRPSSLIDENDYVFILKQYNNTKWNKQTFTKVRYGSSKWGILRWIFDKVFTVDCRIDEVIDNELMTLNFLSIFY